MPRRSVREAGGPGQTTKTWRTLKPFVVQLMSDIGDTRFNILNYGASATEGFDNTAAIRATIAAADAAGGGLVYVPQSTYGFDFRPYDEDDGTEAPLILTFPDGVGLIGDGHSSVLRFIVDDYTIDDAHYCGLMFEGNNLIYGLRIDGNKANLTLTGDKIFYLLRAAANASGLVFQNLWLHDCPGSGENKESFGILLNSGTNTVLMDTIEAYDNAGSGISVNGNNPYPTLEGDNGAGNIQLSNCHCHHNGWQGITCYATHGILVTNCHCHDNDRYGFNIEWCTRLKVSDSEFAYSTLGNFRVLGLSHVVASSCYMHGSAATNEIVIQAGQFHRQFVDEGDESLTWPIAMPEYVELNNCTVITGAMELGSGSVQHLQVRSVEAFDDEEKGQLTLYGGRSYPIVVLNGPGVEEWNITGWIYHRDDPAVRSNVPGLCFPLFRSIRTVALNPMLMWDYGAAMTVVPYAGTDNTDRGAVTLTSDTVETDFFSYPGYPILGGTAELGLRNYHVRCRVKVTQPAGATIDSPDLWGVNISRKGGVGGLALNLVFGSIADDGEWVEAEGIARCGQGEYRVVVFYGERAAAASEDGRLDVDYITVTEISSRQAQSDTAWLGDIQITRGDGLPTTGTYHKKHLHLNTATRDGEPFGWMCHEGGTYGATSATGDTTAEDTAVQSTGGVYAREYITIEGASRLDAQGDVFLIITVDTEDVITLDSAPDATLTGAAIQYSAPVWSELFPAAEEKHISGKPVGSRSAIVFPQEDSIKVWLGSVEMLRGIPRIVLEEDSA